MVNLAALLYAGLVGRWPAPTAALSPPPRWSTAGRCARARCVPACPVPSTRSVSGCSTPTRPVRRHRWRRPTRSTRPCATSSATRPAPPRPASRRPPSSTRRSFAHLRGDSPAPDVETSDTSEQDALDATQAGAPVFSDEDTSVGWSRGTAGVEAGAGAGADPEATQVSPPPPPARSPAPVLPRSRTGRSSPPTAPAPPAPTTPVRPAPGALRAAPAPATAPSHRCGVPTRTLPAGRPGAAVGDLQAGRRAPRPQLASPGGRHRGRAGPGGRHRHRVQPRTGHRAGRHRGVTLIGHVQRSRRADPDRRGQRLRPRGRPPGGEPRVGAARRGRQPPDRLAHQHLLRPAQPAQGRRRRARRPRRAHRGVPGVRDVHRQPHLLRGARGRRRRRCPTSTDGLTRVGRQDDAGTKADVELDKQVTTQYLVVWLTDLPPADGGYKGQVAEIVVR